MRLTGDFLMHPIETLRSMAANDDVCGDADFVAANLATTELTATLAAARAHDDGAP
jgi:hypothetical protein